MYNGHEKYSAPKNRPTLFVNADVKNSIIINLARSNKMSKIYYITQNLIA